MTDPRQVVSVDTIREAARGYAEEKPLREFAAEVGISWTTLHEFLKGASPRIANRKKLTEWYVRTMPVRGESLTPELARAFVASMLDGIPEEKRAAAERDVWRMLAKVYKDAGAEPPRWLSAGGD
jgi:hypothetical protein